MDSAEYLLAFILAYDHRLFPGFTLLKEIPDIDFQGFGDFQEGCDRKGEAGKVRIGRPSVVKTIPSVASGF